MSSADVTVVIVSRNRPGLVCRAVASALAQVEVEVEVIVVDDGSDAPIAPVLHERFGEAVSVIRHDRPVRQAGARNAGIARASGTWIAFLDDDDVWSPEKLIEQLRAATAAQRSWVYAGVVSVDLELRVVSGVRPERPESLIEQLPVRNRFPSGPSNVVVRRALLDRIGGFDTSMLMHEDWDLWLRLSATGLPALADRPLVAYTLHTSNISAVSSEEIMLGADLRLIESRYAHLRGDRPLDRAHVWRWVASGRLRNRDYGGAAQAYARALMANPGESLSRGLRAALSRDHGPSTGFRSPPDEQWRRDAEAWLAPLRAAPGAGHPRPAVGEVDA